MPSPRDRDRADASHESHDLVDRGEETDTNIAPAAGGHAPIEVRVAALEERLRQLQSVLDALLQLRARDRELEEELVRRRAESQQEVMGQVTARLARRPSRHRP